MDKNRALQRLLNGKATNKEIEELKQAVASGEISIGGDMNRSVVIIGSGNKVELTAEALGILKPENTTQEPVTGESPYMGLRYFDTQDADLFYGREALTGELLSRVKNEPFLAIVGASGSGKSSVARAGLIPAWKRENERGAIHIITPTAHPLESLAASLTRDSESVTATSTLMDDMSKEPRSLRLYVKKALGEKKLLLLIDQFEETFTLCKEPEERKAFIENLLSLAEADGAARVVITLRADFYHHCFEYEGLRLTLEKHQANLGAMTQDELREAILKPAETNGWDFQPGLADLILQDIGSEPGALPLLSHALLETWKRRQGCTLTLQGYHEAGGVKKAITQTAESVYAHLTSAEQTIARRIFLDLTELGENAQDTRRRVKLENLVQNKEQDAVTKVLKTLTDARLVTTEEDSAEVAHEALIREWVTLSKWLDENRESLNLYRHMQKSAREWDRRGKEASELYRGARLKQLQGWVKDHGDSLSPLECEFVNTSQKVKKRERLRGAIFVCISIVVLFCSVVLAVNGKFNQYFFIPVDMKDYWVTIPAGEFLMGSSDKQVIESLKTCSECNFPNEYPQHRVYVNTYEIGKYEVTNRQYAECVRAGVCAEGIFSYEYYKDLDSSPVINVNWYGAKTYCEWVGGRLPTEAEWEKAARGGLEYKLYPWGDEVPVCTKGKSNGANFSGGIGCPNDVTAVGSFSANRYGVFDMAGNVSEWTSSLYMAYPNDSNDGREDMNSSADRVIRGGSWVDSFDSVRSASRSWNNPIISNLFIGFRCARTPEGQ
ncbi:MAG TPA: SUMF1/EgtB/PvdO family nonheme iron enzyme [Anaerolineales bacterium]|nr:SUMF1/EgtB/PvdO family nonheme iron enzyme [Anaerolineales bacterium]HNM36995.1 SUMF1/EgtB/PvdO family nonheme iron enzyme [Anaerolineales bacterium]HNO30629.1 SUMF1/EgtB/PvdO family nonheme iron enzyme [Anaerolineales bacterium]